MRSRLELIRGCVNCVVAAQMVLIAGPVLGQAAGPTFPAWTLITPGMSIGSVDGAEPYLLDHVTGARRLSNGNIVIANCGTQELRIFDETGKHLRTVGRRGSGPGEFRYLASLVTVADDTIVVFDSQLRRVSLFSSDGSYLHDFHLSDQFEPVGRFGDGSFLLRSTGARVPSGKTSGIYRSIDALRRIAPDGRVLSELGVFPGQEFEFNGRETRSILFARALSVAALGNGFLVGDQSKAEIGIFDTAGRNTGTFRTVTSTAPVTPAITRTRIDATVAMVRPDQRAIVRRRLESEPPRPHAPELGAFGGFRVAASDRVWVQDGPRGFGTALGWTAYDGGRAVGRLELPPHFLPMEFGADWVLGWSWDGSDVERVVLYRFRPNGERVAIRFVTGPIQGFPIGCLR